MFKPTGFKLPLLVAGGTCLFDGRSEVLGRQQCGEAECAVEAGTRWENASFVQTVGSCLLWCTWRDLGMVCPEHDGTRQLCPNQMNSCDVGDCCESLNHPHNKVVCRAFIFHWNSRNCMSCPTQVTNCSW